MPEPMPESMPQSTPDGRGGASGPMPVERYAELAAEIDVTQDRDAVLGREGLSLEGWLGAQEHWLGRFGDEAAHRRFGLAQRYGQLYLTARVRLQKARDAGRRPGDRPIDVRAERIDLSQATSPAPVAVVETPLAAGLGSAQVAGVSTGPRLTLAQYAGLAAEIAVAPERQTEILGRYGFDEASFGREHQSWQVLFAGDQARFADYLAHFRHYRDWFLGGSVQAGGAGQGGAR